MSYLYGDATTFPFDENFIETICAAIDACVGLFEADVAAEERREKAESVRALAADELKRLNILTKAVENALRPLIPDGKLTRTAEATASKIAGAARKQIEQSRNSVIRRRDSAVRMAMGDALGERVLASVSSLLLSHQLPMTMWSFMWTSGAAAGDASLELRSRAVCGLHATYTVSIPSSSPWVGPVKVAQLAPGFVIELQGKGGWLRKSPKVTQHAFHKLYITDVQINHEREAFTLRRNPKKPSSGYTIQMMDGDEVTPVIQEIDSKGEKKGNPLSLSGEGATALARLWEAIDASVRGLRRHRDALTVSRFADKPLSLVDRPHKIAEAILTALAPTVREMRIRSRVPGELVLKRELGDGRREELFVPRAELEAKFDSLPEEFRMAFESIGLGSETTREFVVREFPRAKMATQRVDPLAPPPVMKAPPPVPKPVKPAKTAKAPPPMPALTKAPSPKAAPKPPPMPPPPDVNTGEPTLPEHAA